MYCECARQASRPTHNANGQRLEPTSQPRKRDLCGLCSVVPFLVVDVRASIKRQPGTAMGWGAGAGRQPPAWELNACAGALESERVRAGAPRPPRARRGSWGPRALAGPGGGAPAAAVRARATPDTSHTTPDQPRTRPRTVTCLRRSLAFILLRWKTQVSMHARCGWTRAPRPRAVRHTHTRYSTVDRRHSTGHTSITVFLFAVWALAMAFLPAAR